MDELGQEIGTIALPAALALTADPVASLIDTAFIGHIGIDFHEILYILIILRAEGGVRIFSLCVLDHYFVLLTGF